MPAPASIPDAPPSGRFAGDAPALALALRMRQHRSERGLSLAEASAPAEIDRSAWSRMEDADRWVTPAVLVRIAKTLGVSPGEAITPPG
ncbi:helix-turn-helix domain-containing protein [Alienimonas sp. DA493]|uniref:helix-turn-helix domain-containing protein n=1 Tax=Alienimonas sp. DA493 TaxID=3373605 RepID=UPI003754DB5D